MKKTFVFIVSLCLFCKHGYSQSKEVNKLYATAEKQMLDGNYTASLETLKREAGSYLNTTDSLIYLKIKVLEFLFPSNAAHTRDLDTTLKLFARKVNKYAFPEQKYAEVGRINSQFLLFKERDKNFYDSISAVAKLERVAELSAINKRITEYLQNIFRGNNSSVFLFK